VIEGVEVPDREFEIGVQWHAESMIDSPPQLRLFRAFVAAAGERVASPERVAAS
jgi:gamma-glutamyl-gamma-aminobutyrate hydrolase PuuD